MHLKRDFMIYKLKRFLLDVFDFLSFVFDDEKETSRSRMKAHLPANDKKNEQPFPPSLTKIKKIMLPKAKHLTVILLLSMSVSYAQKAKVSGNITGLREPSLVFYYPVADSTKGDTVAVKNGKFIWNVAMAHPQKVYVLFPNRMIEFFAERGNIKITGNVDSLDQLKITGSKTQDEAEAFERSLKDITDQEMPLYQKWGKGSKEEQMALEAKVDELRMQKRARANQYIAAHPKSAFSVSLVSDRAMMGAYNDVKTIYDQLDASAQQTTTGKQIAKRLTVLQRSTIGEPMLNFTQNNTEGQPVRFADFKGKYVFVDFWASWCGPCRAENPNVLKAYNQYKNKNFTVIGVSLDDNGEKWKKAIKDDNMPWTQLSDLKGWKNEVSTYYGIMGIPSSLLIDPQGKIIAKDLRGVALHKKLEEIFN
jgi:peroxiredoxin